MAIGVMDFPLLTPQQTSPLGGVLSDAIAKRLAMAQAEKAEKEVPYAGLSAFGNALSHIAYAGAVTPQYAAKLAGHRQIWANMTPEEKDQAVALASAPGTGSGGGALAPVIKQAMDIYNKQNQPSSDLKTSLMNWWNGNNNQQQPLMMPQAGQAPAVNQPVAAAPAQRVPPVVPANLGEQDQASQNEANYVAGQRQAESAGSATGNQMADLRKNVTQQGLSAQMLSQNLQDFHNLYQKAWAKGVFDSDTLRKLDPSGQSGRNVQAIMATNVAGMLYPEGSTNMGKEIAASTKLGFDMTPKAEEEAYLRLKAGSDRAKSIIPFYAEMKRMNITDPQQQQQIWFDYNEAYPYYNHDKHKPNWHNITLDRNEFAQFIQRDLAGKVKFPKEKPPVEKYGEKKLSKKEVVARANRDQAIVDQGDWSHLSDEDLERYANG